MSGDVPLQKQLLELGREADAQMDRVLADAGTMSEAVEGIAKTFTESELKIIRAKLAIHGCAYSQGV